jgi:hypothetical protein
VYLKET